jgi:beta-galactosidase
MSADRHEIAADGEDVAVFAVEVHDAQGRVVPITENEVTFRVSGEGRLIGTGNGDPTNQESDKGTSRKAFSGLCMALAQSTKTSGSVTVEATSPGLAKASVTIASKTATLRTQVAGWEREVPTGSGISGLWRPVPGAAVAPGPPTPFSSNATVFTLRQNGSSVAGKMEGTGGGFFGGSDAPVPITEARIDGNTVSFKAGNGVFTGKVNGDRIELQRTADPSSQPPSRPAEPAGSRPAVGPPPDGSDPSRNPNMRPSASIPLVLHRVQR